jgi:hypothetical protein
MSRALLASFLFLAAMAPALGQTPGQASKCEPGQPSWPSCQFAQGGSQQPGQPGAISGTSRPPDPGNLGSIRDFRSTLSRP